MKKLLLFFFAITIASLLFSQTKSTEYNIIPTLNETTKSATDFGWAELTTFFTNATDINGNTHNLEEYLNAGKYVVIDFSAAWGGPCWSLHQSGLLDDLHDTYGPDGTDEMVVLWIEIESTNTLAQIQGQSTGSTYADYSQGDFTVGGTWPVPIIDDASLITPFRDINGGFTMDTFLLFI